MAEAPPVAPPPPKSPTSEFWTIPNQLTFLRLILSFVLFGLIGYGQWLACLPVFAIAALTDWLDGYIARGYGQGSTLGRNFDPLVDKVLICGAYIYLLPVPASGMEPWLVTIVVVRELVVTVIRSYFEGQGVKFGADWFGKLKMVLQCAALIAVLVYLVMDDPGPLGLIRDLLLYLMALATVLSGAQYLWKAARIGRGTS
jgi:CDP-diacylglycerol--glycerol-3-phosphate 3-phosphatidyltransferase